LPAVASVVASEQYRTGRNKYAVGIIYSDLPYHQVKLWGQIPLQTPPVLTTIGTV
jgi:hypothetical protein